MKAAILIGGSGYIASHLLKRLIKTGHFDHYFVCDIKCMHGLEKEQKSGLVSWHFVDVRKPIELAVGELDSENSWIFNFAAIHREPGHDYNEYFDTNIPGAHHVTKLAAKLDVRNILFTSSIAPYGKSLKQRTETSTLYPETAYGISKALAERIHIEWAAHSSERKIVIVRPSVIYGPGDPGNVLRMIKSLANGTFILPDGGDIIKGYGYIYGLVDSFLFTMAITEPVVVYNYSENPTVPLKEMVSIVKKEFNYKKPTISLPVNVLAAIAFFLQPVLKLLGKKSDIHPVRVRKAGFPTNVKPQYLIDNGFTFNYDFETSLKHWRTIAPEDFK